MAHTAPQGTILGHPKGLFVLFFTEMWERFNYYGMRALLILYMVNFFKWQQEDASQVYKWFTGLCYLTPLIGGFLADKVLGNKWAIILGAGTMALGQLCMTVPSEKVFYFALGIIVIGNGLFKPNMATQVGRLYPPNDPRRDSAYTIFYMGINLGAFIAPILCAELRDAIGFHAGFMAAGIGMLIGLFTYLFFIKWVTEAPPGSVPVTTGASASPKGGPTPPSNHYMTEEAANRAPSVLPHLTSIAPGLMTALGAAAMVISGVLGAAKQINWDDAFAYGAGLGVVCFMAAAALKHIHGAARDRVLTIFMLGLFVIFFWGAFEQSGNAMNLFADKTTNRYVTDDAPVPSVYPVVEVESEKQTMSAAQWTRSLLSTIATGMNLSSPGWFQSSRPIVVLLLIIALLWVWAYLPRRTSEITRGGRMGFTLFFSLIALALLAWPPTRNTLRLAFNPVKTEWFQSINALAIFVLAPLFAWLWIWLPKKGIRLSIPAKMALGIFLQGSAFALMIWCIRFEGQPSGTDLATLPAGVTTDAAGRVIFRDAPDLEDEKWAEAIQATDVDPLHPGIVHGGRILFDAGSRKLTMRGVLADTDRDRILRATVTSDYLGKVRELALASQAAHKTAKAKEDKSFTASVRLDKTPDGFDLRYAGFAPEKVRFDATTHTLTTTQEFADRDYKSLLVAGAESKFRDALNKLYVESAKFKVTSQWLLWFYVLCTLGELCLSPVGLSMVSKLAPKAYGTMLMGAWHVMIFFGNYSAGKLGEFYGTLDPTRYFAYIAVSLTIVSFICFLLVKKIRAMMHGVM